jgi:CRISPR-associated protein Csb2
LFATWQARVPDLDDELVHELLDALTGLPIYAVPPFVQSHTRHYMPDTKHQSVVNPSTDKVLDGFVMTARDAQLGVTWPVDLRAQLRTVLSELVEALPYLGRAESICVGRLLDDDQSLEGATCRPAGSSGDTPIRLLASREPLDIDALTVSTANVRKEALIDPPGARWVEYTTITEHPARHVRTRRRTAHATAVRWAIADTSPRPSVHAAVAMAEALRRAAMSSYGRRNEGGASPVLSGKEPTGTPLRGHQHAHYFALDLDGDRLLDTLVLWAPGRLGPAELAALGELELLRGYSFIREFRPCRLGLEGFGDAADVIPELAVRSAQVWSSHTPFAPARHGRRKQPWENHVVDEVRRELGYRDLPEPSRVNVLHRGGWLDFRRHRLSERLEDARRAVGVDVEFSGPVMGPIALGALSHLGLGVFLPKP